MSINVKLIVNDVVEFDGQLDDIVVNKRFGDNLTANFSLTPTPQRGAPAARSGGGGLDGLAAKLKQASKDGIEQAQANAAAAPPA